jgi:hypothetical protein
MSSVPSQAPLKLNEIVKEKGWYRVPYLDYEDLVFFDRENPDGTITLRNMPKYKKKQKAQRLRVAREMEAIATTLESMKMESSDANMLLT